MKGREEERKTDPDVERPASHPASDEAKARAQRRAFDTECIAKMQRDDDDGVRMLLEEYGAIVRGIVRFRRVAHAHDEDLESAVIDGALSLLRGAAKLSADKNLFGYFLTTVDRAFLKLKAERDRNSLVLLDDLDTRDAAPMDETDEPSDLSDSLREFLATKLSKQEREVIELRSSSDFKLTSAQIAALLGTTASTVDTAMGRAKKKIAEFLEERESGGSQGAGDA